MHPDSLIDYLNKFSKKYELPHINPHAFRHSLASILIFNDIDAVTTSHLLGHSKVSHTTDIYSHFIKASQSKSSNVLTSVLLK